MRMPTKSLHSCNNPLQRTADGILCKRPPMTAYTARKNCNTANRDINRDTQCFRVCQMFSHKWMAARRKVDQASYGSPYVAPTAVFSTPESLSNVQYDTMKYIHIELTQTMASNTQLMDQLVSIIENGKPYIRKVTLQGHVPRRLIQTLCGRGSMIEELRMAAATDCDVVAKGHIRDIVRASDTLKILSIYTEDSRQNKTLAEYIYQAAFQKLHTLAVVGMSNARVLDRRLTGKSLKYIYLECLSSSVKRSMCASVPTIYDLDWSQSKATKDDGEKQRRLCFVRNNLP